jgi:3-isopropylmalate/(R)-2-methylmalate dehydratase small subunit
MKGKAHRFGDDVNTDYIISGRHKFKTLDMNELAKHVMEDLDPHFVKRLKKGDFMVAGKNFGCGSSREHAPQAIGRWREGIRAIVGESFAEIFFGNCVSLGMPCVAVDAASIEMLQKAVTADATVTVTVDLQDKVVSAGALRVPLRIPDGVRQQFLDGRWDTTGELLANRDAILALAKKLPYLSSF